MIGDAPSTSSIAERRAGWIASMVSAVALASLTTIAVSWPETPPSADAVPLDLGDPVSVALAFAQRHHALDPDVCMLTTSRGRTQLGREARCLPTDRRPRPEVRVLTENRSAGASIAVVEIRPHAKSPQQIRVGLVRVDDRWLVDSVAPAPVEQP